MINLLLILVCFTGGLLVKRFVPLPPEPHKGINAWIIHLALPAVSFKYLPEIVWTKALLLPALMPVMVWVGGWIYMKIYSRYKQLDKRTATGMRLVISLSNTSFIGFPLVAAYFGESRLGIAVICDQVTFLLMATFGILAAIKGDGGATDTRQIVKRLTRFTPLWACLLALSLPHFVSLRGLNPLFDSLAATVAPMAIFSIGLQLQVKGWKQELQHISVALLYKLVLAPILVLAVVLVAGMRGPVAEVTIFESSMAAFITAGIVANQYNLNPKLTNLIVSLSILLSFLTTAIWFGITQYVLY